METAASSTPVIMSTRQTKGNACPHCSIRSAYFINLNIPMAMMHWKINSLYHTTRTPLESPRPKQFWWMLDATFDTRITFHSLKSLCRPYYLAAPNSIRPRRSLSSKHIEINGTAVCEWSGKPKRQRHWRQRQRNKTDYTHSMWKLSLCNRAFERNK